MVTLLLGLCEGAVTATVRNFAPSAMEHLLELSSRSIVDERTSQESCKAYFGIGQTSGNVSASGYSECLGKCGS